MKNLRRVIRKMGYIRDQEGIMNRYLGESENWKLHLDNTRNFITASFRDTSVRKLAVLGSGWLLDVPLDQLADRYERVFLVDICHPPQIVKKVESMAGIELVEADLTGGALEQVWFITRHEPDITANSLTSRIELSTPLEEIGADAYVSVNTLNQLDIILCDYLRQFRSIEMRSLEPFRHKLQRFHIDWITGKPGCLITDSEEVSEDRKGIRTSTPLLHTNLPKGFRTGQWEWIFDTRGTYRKGFRTHMTVKAVEWAGF
jgi:hypothetical protein